MPLPPLAHTLPYLQVLRESGVPASDSFYVQLQLNGAFYGLYGFVEDDDSSFLVRHGLAPSFKHQGPLFKSEDGESSNLRWDVPMQDLHFYW